MKSKVLVHRWFHYAWKPFPSQPYSPSTRCAPPAWARAASATGRRVGWGADGRRPGRGCAGSWAWASSARWSSGGPAWATCSRPASASWRKRARASSAGPPPAGGSWRTTALGSRHRVAGRGFYLSEDGGHAPMMSVLGLCVAWPPICRRKMQCKGKGDCTRKSHISRNLMASHALNSRVTWDMRQFGLRMRKKIFNQYWIWVSK